MMSHTAMSLVDSKDSVKACVTAVRESPFKTALVVDVDKQRIVCAVSQNPDYVVAARKKGVPLAIILGPEI